MKQLSKFLGVNAFDMAKSAIVAAFSAAGATLYNFIENGHFPQGWDQWKGVVMAGVGAALAYLLKNALTNSQGEFGKKEPVQP